MSEPDGGSVLWRVGDIERNVQRLMDWRGTVDEQRSRQSEQMTGINRSMDDLSNEVKGLRRTLTTLAFSIAGSCLVFGLSVLVATGKIG